MCSEGSYAFSRRVSVASDLWSKYRTWKELTPDEEAIVLQDYFEDGSELYLESQLVGAGEGLHVVTIKDHLFDTNLLLNSAC